MNLALDLAAFLVVAVGVAHSYLGERYILVRLFCREDLPAIFGSARFTRRTLRYAWHITAVAWLGFGAVLYLLGHGPFTRSAVGLAVGIMFLVSGLVALFASRGKHLSWPVFLAIGALSILATRG
ncbi:MAG: hypothetical protein HKN20_06755 [Gemmatimonadetes bacterium]|nr:hypothetical protein [Gemmatimonadota bacterium]